MFDDGGTTSGENRQRVSGWPVSSGRRILFPFHLKKRIFETTFSWNSSWNCYPLHRVEFGPPKFFSNFFSIFHNILFNFANFRGGALAKNMQIPKKKNRNRRKSRANSRNPLEPFLRSRKEKNLYGHCAMNNARLFFSKGSTCLSGCWF